MNIINFYFIDIVTQCILYYMYKIKQRSKTVIYMYAHNNKFINLSITFTHIACVFTYKYQSIEYVNILNLLQ